MLEVESHVWIPAGLSHTPWTPSSSILSITFLVCKTNPFGSGIRVLNLPLTYWSNHTSLVEIEPDPRCSKQAAEPLITMSWGCVSVLECLHYSCLGQKATILWLQFRLSTSILTSLTYIVCCWCEKLITTTRNFIAFFHRNFTRSIVVLQRWAKVIENM